MNAVFIHIPKTAGLSILDALKIPIYKKELVKGFKYEGIISFGHYPMWYVMTDGFFDPEGWFLFTFVRNPFDRFVSHYSFSVKMKYFSGTFKEYCHSLPELHEYVKARQSDWLIGVDVGFVGKFERLEQDFKKLCKILRVKNVKLKHINATTHKPWREYYDKDLAYIVYEHYQKDFERFKYSFGSAFE